MTVKFNHKNRYYIEKHNTSHYTLYERTPNNAINSQCHTADSLEHWIQQSQSLELHEQYRNNNSPIMNFAGISLEQPRIMGILNITPDSFSDGGDFMNENNALHHAHSMIAHGAAIIDIGGESTRPNADDVSESVQLKRILPIVSRLKNIPLSIDTRRTAVMLECLTHGATIINDVSALTDDRSALEAIAPYKPHIILMHKSSQPKTMMQHTTYSHVVFDIYDYLKERIDACIQAGIPKHHIAIDAGIGFGKTKEQDYLIHKMASVYLGLGCVLLWATSRKKFLTDAAVPPKERDGASIASLLWGIQQGARMVRVHNVKQTKQAIDVWLAIKNKGN